MTQALWRLLFICLVAAASETIASQLELFNDIMLVGVVSGAVAYLLTQGQGGRPRPGGGGRRGEIKYWRGQRIDDDERPRKLN